MCHNRFNKNIFIIIAIAFAALTHLFMTAGDTSAALTQNAYRWYYKADSADPTAAIAAENTDPSLAAATSTPIHLRMSITTTGSGVGTGTQALQLQSAFSTSGPWADVKDPWWDTTMSHRRKITVGSTTNTLTDFPLPVFLYSSTTASSLGNNIDYSRTQNSGQDIRFATASGTPLQYQIEKWSETGTSTIWVKIPSIATSTWPAGLPRQASSTYLWMYYGNTSTTSNATTTGVWDANYKGVWHMGEDPTGTEPTIKDSTKNALNGTEQGGMVAGDSVAGKLGNALEFDGGANDYVVVSSNAALNSANVTVSAWIKGSSQVEYNYFISKGANTCEVASYGLSTYVNGGAADSTENINFSITPDGAVYNSSSNTAVLNGTWRHMTGVFDDTNNLLQFYVDGAQISSTANTNSIDHTGTTNNDLGFGNYLGTCSLLGTAQLDEIHVSGVNRGAAWIKAEYNSQHNPNFNTYGPEEAYATTTVWRFANATSTIDNATTTSLLLTGSDKNESYEEASTTPGFLTALAANEDGEFDFYLDPTQATTTNTYYFRLIRATSTVALETYTNYPTITVGAVASNPAFTQRNYRWFLNENNNVQPGDPKANMNTAITDIDTGNLNRLRMDVSVATADLAYKGQVFDLQYKTLGAGCDAAESWTNVGGATSTAIWKMYDNGGVGATSTITTALLNASNIAEIYSEVETHTDFTAINSGQIGEWDWPIYNNGATAGTTYCFRIQKNGGTALDTYSNYPQLTTATATPIVGIGESTRGGGSSGGGGIQTPVETPSTGATGGGGGSEGGSGGAPPETPTTGAGGGGGGGESGYAPRRASLFASIIEAIKPFFSWFF